MRSSVSSILSNNVYDVSVSQPDYRQLPADHATVLILVQYDLNSDAVQDIAERIIVKYTRMLVPDNNNGRMVCVKFVRNYPVENNAWGDFQTHRKLLGLITITINNDEPEFLDCACKSHMKLVKIYERTLIDSRLLVFTLKNNQDQKHSMGSFVRFCDNIESDIESKMIELISSIYYVLEAKRLENKRIEKLTLFVAPFEHKEFLNVEMESKQYKKRCSGRYEKYIGDLCVQIGRFGDALARYASAIELLRSVNDWLWLAASFEGLCIASSLILYPDLLNCEYDAEEMKLYANSMHLLIGDDILNKYREAIINYSKYQNAAIIEIEAGFKAAKIALVLKERLIAISFLQNIIFVNFNKSEQEKIERFETLADYYNSMRLKRKSAFYARLAAIRYVSPQHTVPNWSKCYTLMLTSFGGYYLSLDPNEMCQKQFAGWPALQIQLLQDLVVAAKRMGQSALATRHMTFLLQTMWRYLSDTARLEFCEQLRVLAAQCEGSPVPLVLDSGLIIPPANLIHVPDCVSFTVQKLPICLQPKKIERVKRDAGPFLFTPIQFGSLDAKNTKPKKILWVENEKGSVQLQLVNYLPIDLTVCNMQILVTGVVFETIPETITLRSNEPYQMTLTGIPKEHGDLEILGYSMHALGVKSNCKLKYFRKSFDKCFVNVLPPLPQLEIDTGVFYKSTSLMVTNNENKIIMLDLFNGECVEREISLKNISNVSINFIEVTLTTTPNDSSVFSWLPGQSKLDLQLPLVSNSSILVFLHVSSCSPFILYPVSRNSDSPKFFDDSSSVSFRRFINSASFRSSKSSTIKQSLVSNNLIEGAMQVRYSGGDGYRDGYCREIMIPIEVEVMQSLQIVNWDVLPAENYAQFYLVLDIVNLTNYEMEVLYSINKTIQIETNEKCRIPILCERCPLEKFSKFFENRNNSTTIDEIHDICSTYVANQIELNWSLAAIQRSGIVKVSEIPFSIEMIEQIKMSPIRLNVFFNDELIQLQGEFYCRVNDIVTIRLEIENVSNWTLNKIAHKFDIFLDYRNGIKDFDMKSKVLINGPNSFFEDQLLQTEKAQYFINVIFLITGSYKLRTSYQIDGNSIDDWKYIPSIDIIVEGK